MLPRIKLLLGDKMVKTVMIYENLTVHSIKIVSPNINLEKYHDQLRIMSEVIVLVYLKLPLSISHNITLLHQ